MLYIYCGTVSILELNNLHPLNFSVFISDTGLNKNNCPQQCCVQRAIYIVTNGNLFPAFHSRGEQIRQAVMTRQSWGDHVTPERAGDWTAAEEDVLRSQIFLTWLDTTLSQVVSKTSFTSRCAAWPLGYLKQTTGVDRVTCDH